MGLTYNGKKCCVGKLGGIYMHKKGKKLYLTKKQKKKVKGKKKKGGRVIPPDEHRNWKPSNSQKFAKAFANVFARKR